MIFERQFLTLHFLSMQLDMVMLTLLTYILETFTTWEEQRNSFALGEEKEKYV